MIGMKNYTLLASSSQWFSKQTEKKTLKPAAKKLF
jgi:hypothetical protein